MGVPVADARPKTLALANREAVNAARGVPSTRPLSSTRAPSRRGAGDAPGDERRDSRCPG